MNESLFCFCLVNYYYFFENATDVWRNERKDREPVVRLELRVDAPETPKNQQFFILAKKFHCLVSIRRKFRMEIFFFAQSNRIVRSNVLAWKFLKLLEKVDNKIRQISDCDIPPVLFDNKKTKSTQKIVKNLEKKTFHKNRNFRLHSPTVFCINECRLRHFSKKMFNAQNDFFFVTSKKKFEFSWKMNFLSIFPPNISLHSPQEKTPSIEPNWWGKIKDFSNQFDRGGSSIFFRLIFRMWNLLTRRFNAVAKKYARAYFFAPSAGG